MKLSPPASPSSVSLVLATTAALAAAAVSPPSAAAGAQPFPATDSHVVTVVKVRRPWYAPRFVFVRRFRDSIPQYRAVPGLEAKTYVLSEDGHFGGIYLWRDRAAAEAWFSPAWFARVRRERGVSGKSVTSRPPGCPMMGPTRLRTNTPWPP